MRRLTTPEEVGDVIDKRAGDEGWRPGALDHVSYFAADPAETCPLPSPPLNGYVSLDNSTTFSESRYTCNSGYKVVGTANRICLRDRGVWSGNDVRCKRLRCSSLFSPLFGYVDFNGTQAVFSCRSGYLLVGSRVLVCRVTEEWSGEAPTCVKNRTFCPLLSAPEDGQVSVRSRTFGSTATYSCDTGKTLVGERTRTCLSDGTWSRRKPICSGMYTSDEASFGG